MQVVFIILFLVLGSVFYSWWIRHTWNNGAPYEGMPPDVVERVLKLANIGPKDIVYDLGSGDGRVVIGATMKGATAYGVEIDRFRVWYSKVWVRLLRLNKKAKVSVGDVFKTDLSKATVVIIYLLPETHDKLETKLEKELKKGTRVVAVGFEVSNWKPEEIDPRGGPYGPIYLYKI